MIAVWLALNGGGDGLRPNLVDSSRPEEGGASRGDLPTKLPRRLRGIRAGLVLRRTPEREARNQIASNM